MIHHFPYDPGDFPPLEIPDSCRTAVYRLAGFQAPLGDIELIRTALANPIGCVRLQDQVKPGMKVTIAVDDISRSTRTDLMLPLVLEELQAAGIPDKDITVLIAIGTHRCMSKKEMELKYTAEAVARYRFVNPDWKDHSEYADVGRSKRGFNIRLHKEIPAADYLIGVGQTIPHMIAGFGGGGKIINPGCADAETIGEMHWLCSEVPEDQLFAVRDNAVRETIDEIAMKAGLKFILNDVPGGGDRLAGAFAGHPIEAHREACRFSLQVCAVPLEQKADIVISDSYPADIDFWQGLKGLNAAYGAVRNGGTVILVSPCPEGASAQHHELTTIGYIEVDKIRQMVQQGTLDKCIAANLVLGRWLLEKADAILISKGIPESDTRAMGFDWAPSAAAALEKALSKHGPKASVNVLYKAAKMVCRCKT